MKASYNSTKRWFVLKINSSCRGSLKDLRHTTGNLSVSTRSAETSPSTGPTWAVARSWSWLSQRLYSPENPETFLLFMHFVINSKRLPQWSSVSKGLGYRPSILCQRILKSFARQSGCSPSNEHRIRLAIKCVRERSGCSCHLLVCQRSSCSRARVISRIPSNPKSSVSLQANSKSCFCCSSGYNTRK